MYVGGIRAEKIKKKEEAREKLRKGYWKERLTGARGKHGERKSETKIRKRTNIVMSKTEKGDGKRKGEMSRDINIYL